MTGIDQVVDAKARWLGHKLHADVTIAVDDNMSVAVANKISATLERELFAHLPALAAANVRLAPSMGLAVLPPRHGGHGHHDHDGHGHHHAPEPFYVQTNVAEGLLQIVETKGGERMRLTLSHSTGDLEAVFVIIDRPGEPEEVLNLDPAPDCTVFQSRVAPAEPHEFTGELQLYAGGKFESLHFRMVEPHGYGH